MIKYINISILCLVLSASTFGQTPEIRAAFEKYQAGELNVAEQMVNDALKKDTAAQNQAISWNLKGFIYKDLFKKTTEEPTRSDYRNNGVQAFYESFEKRGAEEFKGNGLKGLRFLASSFYNDAVVGLRAKDHETALTNFEAYKKHMKFVDSGYDFDGNDKQFYNGLAGVYSYHFLKNRGKNEEFFAKSIEYYEIVLNLDAEDWNAIYNSGILYYNEGVHIIKASDEEADFTTLELIQDQSKELFEKALPYMLKAHKLQPDREEAITALSGIYFGLHELDKSDYYQGLLEQ